ncbi:hypothetical protein [Yunchengibacter salinarum]|uniref:hypothetical protein n=1 Tax=Yunchengibacter salinarum TaxID=3133399 RepID=UPI0035B61634
MHYSPRLHQAAQDFDPDFYFDLVAENLLSNLGTRALGYADEALKKMKRLGDDEGFSLWLEIHAHLTTKAADALRPKGVTLH